MPAAVRPIEIRDEQGPVVVGPAIASPGSLHPVLEPHEWGNLHFPSDGRFHVEAVPRDDRTTTGAFVAMLRFALEPEESKAGLIVVDRTMMRLAETLMAGRGRWLTLESSPGIAFARPGR